MNEIDVANTEQQKTRPRKGWKMRSVVKSSETENDFVTQHERQSAQAVILPMLNLLRLDYASVQSQI